jgi:hypothetical protein
MRPARRKKLEKRRTQIQCEKSREMNLAPIELVVVGDDEQPKGFFRRLWSKLFKK